ncbi:hypothetical protein BCR35DRAFT_283397 [Leucosporidium creatinivorum]|uniref:Ribosomal protein S11-domain-containing protein n=1 Tax=Leucosporidium creatinivorum TaxID=106004 RepID=A0A1Y2DRM2_9BASI|nr:hypothetical protein BCR35DRAFT_283397 [Leucosporidium creatinivorum]
MFASTSKTMLARSWAKPTALRFLSTAPPPTTPLVPDTLPVSPPTSALPGSPLPEAYRAPAPTADSTPSPAESSSSSRFTPAVRRPSTGFGGQRRQSNFYRLSVFASRNNTILTLTTTPGATSAELSPEDPHHAVAWVSGGSAGYKGASRGTYDAAVEVSLRMFKKITDLVNPPIGSGGQRKKVIWAAPTDLEVVWKGFGQGRDAVYRTLMGGEGDGVRQLVRRVTDATPLKVGGTRAKKRRVI